MEGSLAVLLSAESSGWVFANAHEVEMTTLSCHKSSHHGNGQRWKGIDKMETKEEEGPFMIRSMFLVYADRPYQPSAFG